MGSICPYSLLTTSKVLTNKSGNQAAARRLLVKQCVLTEGTLELGFRADGHPEDQGVL